MFCTAEAAGGTLILLPEARYKTSFYSMLDQGGQTHPSLDEVSCSVAKPLIFLGKLPPRRPENSATWQTGPGDLSP